MYKKALEEIEKLEQDKQEIAQSRRGRGRKGDSAALEAALAKRDQELEKKNEELETKTREVEGKQQELEKKDRLIEVS
jgi:molybdenum-dependent DNA-binding transcriptional regulator ModE